MRKITKLILAGAGAVLVVGAGAGIAVASGAADDSDTPITGDALAKASEAALASTGEGTVSDTEAGDEESLYEVEVTLSDGSQVDVQLDESFTVVGSEADREDGKDD